VPVVPSKRLLWDQVVEGEALPILVKEITATTIVAGAIAARDFAPIHHDFRAAQRAGLSDIVMNNITTGGLVGRYLTDWSGPEGELKRIKFRLGLPCHPGDTLTMTGKVVRKRRHSGEHLVDLEYDFLVPRGSHCRGVATICLPTMVAESA
jgi:acyl dehydratase